MEELDPWETAPTEELDPWEEPSTVAEPDLAIPEEDPTANVNGDTTGYKGGFAVDISTAKEGPGGQKEPPSPDADEAAMISALEEKVRQNPDAPSAKEDQKLIDAFHWARQRSADKKAGKIDAPELRKQEQEFPKLAGRTQAALQGHNVSNPQFKTDEDLLADQAVNDLRATYTDRVIKPQEELTKAADDYQFFASGIDASGVRQADIPDNYVPGVDEYGDGPGAANPFKWEMLLRDKSKRMGEGGSTLNNYQIPSPIMTVNPMERGNEAAREYGKKVVMTAAAGIDSLLGTRYAEDVDKMIANPPQTKTMLQKLQRDAIKMVGTTVAGVGIGGALEKGVNATAGLKSIPLLGRAIANLTTLVVGATALQPEDGTLVVGDNALIKAFDGLPKDENGTFSEKYFTDFLNQEYDAIITGSTVGAGFWTVGKGLGALYRMSAKPLIQAMTTEGQSDYLVAEMMKRLGVNSSEQMRELVARMKPEELMKIAADGEAELAAIQAGRTLGGPEGATIKRTSMSAIHEGMKDVNPTIATQAMEMERNAGVRGLPNLANKQNDTFNELRRVQNSAIDLRGGAENMHKPGQLVGQQAVDNVNPSILEKGRLSEEQIHINNELERLQKEDPQFGGIVNEFLKTAGVDDATNATLKHNNTLIQKIAVGVATVKKKSKELYAKFPKDVPIPDVESFDEVVAPALENGWLPKELQDMMTTKLKQETAGLEDAKTASKIEAEIKAWRKGKMALPEGVDTAGVRPDDGDLVFDSRAIFNDFLPKLNKVIAETIEQGNRSGKMDSTKLEGLKAIKNNILNEQLDALATMDPEAAGIYKAANDYYKNNIGKFKENTIMGEFFDSFDRVEPYSELKQGIKKEGPGYASNITDPNLGDAGAADEMLKTVKKMSDDNPATSQQAIQFWRREEFPEGTDKDWYNATLGSVAKMIRHKLSDSDDLTKIKPSDILKELEGRGYLLKKEFPAESTQLEKFINDVRDIAVKKGNVEAELLKVEKEAKIAVDNMRASHAAKFVEGKGDGTWMVKGNPRETLKNMFKDPHAGNHIDAILHDIKQKGDVEALAGMEGAYFDTLKDMANNTTGKQGANTKNIADFTDPNSALYQYGDMIFGQGAESIKKKELDLFRELHRVVKGEMDKATQTGVSTTHEGEMTQRAEEGFGLIVTGVYGKLSRMGSTVRDVGRKSVRTLDLQEMSRALLDKFYTDPEELTKQIMRLADIKDKEIPLERMRREFPLLMLNEAPSQLQDPDYNADPKAMKVPEGVK